MIVLLGTHVRQVLGMPNVRRSVGERESLYARNVKGFSGFSLYINYLTSTLPVAFFPFPLLKPCLTLRCLTLRPNIPVVTFPVSLEVEC
jgi:hypothetical protein